MSESEVTLRQLIGEQLSAVTFVQDYLQLHFDGPCLNVYNPLTVTTINSTVKTWDNQLRNTLCGQIAKTVVAITIVAHRYLRITLVDGVAISISLSDKDYTTAEALYYHGFQNDNWGVL